MSIGLFFISAKLLKVGFSKADIQSSNLREFYSHLSLPCVLLEEQHETGSGLSQSKLQ